MATAIYVEDVAEFEIENGNVRMRVVSNEETIDMHFPLGRFRVGHAKVRKMLAEHDASGEVVEFPAH